MSSEKGYTFTVRELIPYCVNLKELIKKVQDVYNVKSSKDKGFDSIRIVAKREWNKEANSKKTSPPKNITLSALKYKKE